MAKKPAAKKAAPKAAAKTAPAKKPVPKKPAAKPVAKKAGPKSVWFDAANKPLIAEYAQRLQPFIDAMADGRIEEHELAAQEGRLIAVMREVEPLLSADLHEKVTRLLCEMAAYDLMQSFAIMNEQRPETVFRG